MRRGVWIAIVAVVIGAMGFGVVALRPQRRWSTDSSAAAAEFEAGQQAELKFYRNEALQHYAKAVELDPDFVIAKLYLATGLGWTEQERTEALFAEVKQADLDTLNPKEQFRVSYTLAMRQGRSSDAARLREEYLAREPGDAYAVFTRCGELWAVGDWAEAESCNRHVLELDPNWAVAYNYLGYIAMAQERFADAEKQFRAYRFIAPDQANPHDSLGELLTLTGRYDEAASEFNQALEVRPDFCDSYGHLLVVKLLASDPAGAQEVVARAEAGGLCEPAKVQHMRCSLENLGGQLTGDWERIWRAAESGCLKGDELAPVFTHRAAVMTGRLDKARVIEEKVSKYLGHSPSSPEPGGKLLIATVEHMQAVRRLAEGDALGAVSLFREVDRKTVFRGNGQSFFKIFNRDCLANALLAAALDDEAAQVLAGIRAINPGFADRMAAAHVTSSAELRTGAASMPAMAKGVLLSSLGGQAPTAHQVHGEAP